MKNFQQSKKALSAAVASIILIAVAVAVSLAVATWLASISTRNMETEEVKIINVSFNSQTATLDFKNIGATDVVIIEIRVGNSDDLLGTDLELNSNSFATVTFALDWTPGAQYQFRATSAKGNVFVYNAIAS